MTVDRRSFLRTLGVGSAAALVPWAQARGRESGDGWGLSATPPLRLSATPLRLDSNENPLGPPPEALKAIGDWYGEAGRYPDMVYEGLFEAVARYAGVARENILFGSGSSEILKVAVEAFVSAERALVTAAPTFELPTTRARSLDRPVRELPVDRGLGLDLDAMIAACDGAGMVFLCNPNNPTGTLHGGAAVRDAIGRMLRRSPDVVVLVDEAYHEYVNDPGYASMIPLALAEPRVVVARTFSKAFGMAGLRLGYAVGRPETLRRMRPHLVANNVNQLVGGAAIGALGVAGFVDRERQRNLDARRFTEQFFREAGYQVTPSEANFMMVDIRRELAPFREACRTRGVMVGRPFPPLTRQVRVSIGTMEEMRQACRVFGEVLG